MTKRMIVTIGYERYTASADAVAELIAVVGRFKHLGQEDYGAPYRPHQNPEPIVKSIEWGDVVFDEIPF